MAFKEMTTTNYEQAYSDSEFWRKLGARTRAFGRELIEQALVLYYTLRSEDTPVWAKTVILGALGYFISIVDAIPDITPVVGYTDDISVMVAALAAVARSVTPEIRERARLHADALFGKQ